MFITLVKIIIGLFLISSMITLYLKFVIICSPTIMFLFSIFIILKI